MRSFTYEGTQHACIKRFYYTGFSFNTTPGSRANLGAAIEVGDCVCLDPLIPEDVANGDVATGTPTGLKLPPGMDADNAYEYLGAFVTRPATGIRRWFAGPIVGMQDGKSIWTAADLDDQSEAIWVDVAVRGPCRLYTNANFTPEIDDDESCNIYVAQNGSFDAAIGTDPRTNTATVQEELDWGRAYPMTNAAINGSVTHVLAYAWMHSWLFA